MTLERPSGRVRRCTAARALAALLCCISTGAAVAAVPTMPFDEVRPGMRGTGRTVFEGTTVSTFDVEILGTVPRIGPDQDLILARCTGGPLAETGVLSGMSGSPVVIDGKLVGAVAYSWGFSTEAIAGITPIDEMLAVSRRDGEPPRRVAGARFDDVALERLLEPSRAASFVAGLARGLGPRANGALPVSVPVAVAGLGAAGLPALGELLSPLGLLPLQSGGSGAASGPAPRIEPGSAVGLQLVRGDVEMTATGTVTWVDGDEVLAFGHPLFGLGAIDLPLTGARVQALLPSLQQSARIATPTGEVGALRQDRASGVYGRLGARPRMIPVRLSYGRAGGPERAYSFEVADDPLLSPLLLYATLNGILAGRDRMIGSTTIRLAEGSVIKMAGRDDVALDNVFAGPQAFEYGTGIAAYLLYVLMNNAWSPPRIAGVNLIVEYDDLPRTGRIERAFLDRYRARPGDEIEATVVVSPFRGPDQPLTTRFVIPEETPPGTLTLLVGGAQAVARDESGDEPVLPRDLDQLVRLINQLRRNDQVYLVATRPDSGVLLGGARLPNLPPSVTRVLTRPRSQGLFTRVPRRLVLEEAIPTDFAVEGSAMVQVEVTAP